MIWTNISVGNILTGTMPTELASLTSLNYIDQGKLYDLQYTSRHISWHCLTWHDIILYQLYLCSYNTWSMSSRRQSKYLRTYSNWNRTYWISGILIHRWVLAVCMNIAFFPWIQCTLLFTTSWSMCRKYWSSRRNTIWNRKSHQSKSIKSCGY